MKYAKLMSGLGISVSALKTYLFRHSSLVCSTCWTHPLVLGLAPDKLHLFVFTELVQCLGVSLPASGNDFCRHFKSPHSHSFSLSLSFLVFHLTVFNEELVS